MGEDPSRAADPSGPDATPRPAGPVAPSGPGSPAPTGFGQGPRTGPSQGDAPWQRADGPAGPAPEPDPDSLWVTGGVLFAGILMLF